MTFFKSGRSCAVIPLSIQPLNAINTLPPIVTKDFRLCQPRCRKPHGIRNCANQGIQNGHDLSLSLLAFMNFLFIGRNFIDILFVVALVLEIANRYTTFTQCEYLCFNLN